MHYASIQRMLFFIAKITTKTDEKAVFFESFQGRSFACSPKAMYLQMQQDDKYKDFSFFWGLRKTDREDFSNKKNTQLVKFESYSYYKALAKAKYWIVNSNTRLFLKPGKNMFRPDMAWNTSQKNRMRHYMYRKCND